MENVLVTNGSATLEVLAAILPYIDAMNIDLKGFRAGYYQKLGGDLETVKPFIVHAAASCHVELTTLVVPGENDSEAEMEEEAKWIASAVGKDVPLMSPVSSQGIRWRAGTPQRRRQPTVLQTLPAGIFGMCGWGTAGKRSVRPCRKRGRPSQYPLDCPCQPLFCRG